MYTVYRIENNMYYYDDLHIEMTRKCINRKDLIVPKGMVLYNIIIKIIIYSQYRSTIIVGRYLQYIFHSDRLYMVSGRFDQSSGI